MLPHRPQSILLPSDAAHNEFFPMQRHPSSLPSPGRCCVQDRELYLQIPWQGGVNEPWSCATQNSARRLGWRDPHNLISCAACTLGCELAGLENSAAQEAGKGEHSSGMQAISPSTACEENYVSSGVFQRTSCGIQEACNRLVV